MLKTASTTGWDLELGYFKVGGATLVSGNRNVLFEPGEPYIYLNAQDYTTLAKTL
jgi:hypothetical protein